MLRPLAHAPPSLSHREDISALLSHVRFTRVLIDFRKEKGTTYPVYRLEGDRSFAVSLSLGKHRDTEAQWTLWDKTNKEVISFKMVVFVFSGTSQPSSPRWVL